MHVSWLDRLSCRSQYLDEKQIRSMIQSQFRMSLLSLSPSSGKKRKHLYSLITHSVPVSLDMLRSFWLISLVLLRLSQSSNVDLYFQIQPQLVRVNNLNEMYITNDEHFLGQVLYRHDQIQLACDCQTAFTRVQWEMHWSMNNVKLYQPKNSTSIQLLVNAGTMRAPVTSVTCHCTFTQKNSTKVQRSYQYQLYIGREIFFK